PGMVNPRALHEADLADDLRPQVQRCVRPAPSLERQGRPWIGCCRRHPAPPSARDRLTAVNVWAPRRETDSTVRIKPLLERSQDAFRSGWRQAAGTTLCPAARLRLGHDSAQRVHQQLTLPLGADRDPQMLIDSRQLEMADDDAVLAQPLRQ